MRRTAHGDAAAEIFHGGGQGGELLRSGGEELEVAQPTLSIAVRNLEQELGVQLFYTFGRRQRLTDEDSGCWRAPSG